MQGVLEQVWQVGGCKRILDLPKVASTCPKCPLHSTCAYVIMVARGSKLPLNFPDVFCKTEVNLIIDGNPRSIHYLFSADV